jgi:hypothetical protein
VVAGGAVPKPPAVLARGVVRVGRARARGKASRKWKGRDFFNLLFYSFRNSIG